MSEVKNFLNKHINIVTIVSLFVIFSLIFFYGLGTYRLMDVDETRYVSMARDMFNTKDFMTLYLNGEYFFEKPPLYFWQECLSFFAFGGKINEFTARFAPALLGFILSFIVYFVGKFRVDRKFGVIASLITATSLEFVILSRYAILDIVLTFYVGLSLLSYFQTFFCKEKNKKYFWWLFYIFSGLAVLAKGIPGIAIPFGTAFFVSIFTKRFKENFKPQYLIPGGVLFFLIVLPWHILMLHKYNPLFFNEYIIKHHLHRFINTANNEIGRKQPFYYYFATVLWGFIPWIFSSLAVLIGKFINIKNENFIKIFDFYKLDNMGKLVILSTIAACWIMLFFSSSSTKLVTYILPIYMLLSIVTASVWYRYIYNNEYNTPVNRTVNIVGWTFGIVALLALVVQFFLPNEIVSYIDNVKWQVIISLLLFSVFSLVFLKSNNKKGIFITYVMFMVFLSAFCMGEFFNVDYKFGQNEMVELSNFAKQNNYNVSAVMLDRKYSLIYYVKGGVNYNKDIENEEELTQGNLDKVLDKDKTVILIKNKKLKKVQYLKYNVLKEGKYYSLLIK